MYVFGRPPVLYPLRDDRASKESQPTTFTSTPQRARFEVVHTDMTEELSCTCGGCDRELRAESRRITYWTEAGERRADECPCGAVTITVAR
jgi:hypothetical protein